MEELDFYNPEQAIAASEELVRRMAEYRSALEEDRDKAVDLYLGELKREGPADRTLEPFHAVYLFDESRTAGKSQEDRVSIFQHTLDVLDRVVMFCDPCTVPWWRIVREVHVRAVLYAGDLDRAEAIAFELLSESDRGFPVGQDNDQKHFAEQILGQVALRRGDKNDAVRYLLSSVDLSFVDNGHAPVLCSFGPKMRLADELYDAGETGAVLAYLIKITEFWEFHAESVQRWIAAIRAGNGPRDRDWAAQMIY